MLLLSDPITLSVVLLALHQDAKQLKNIPKPSSSQKCKTLMIKSNAWGLLHQCICQRIYLKCISYIYIYIWVIFPRTGKMSKICQQNELQHFKEWSIFATKNKKIARTKRKYFYTPTYIISSEQLRKLEKIKPFGHSKA